MSDSCWLYEVTAAELATEALQSDNPYRLLAEYAHNLNQSYTGHSDELIEERRKWCEAYDAVHRLATPAAETPRAERS